MRLREPFTSRIGIEKNADPLFLPGSNLVHHNGTHCSEALPMYVKPMPEALVEATKALQAAVELFML